MKLIKAIVGVFVVLFVIGMVGVLFGSGGGGGGASSVSVDPSYTAPVATQNAMAKSKTHVSMAERQAILAAKEYLATQAFSRQGLIDQLDSSAGSGFSKTASTLAVESLHVNWNDQAVKAAKAYLDVQAFSRSGLTSQLESSAGSQFTHSQAVYAVKRVGL